MKMLIGTLVLAGGVTASAWPPEVEEALAKAGENRAQLDQVLEHYRRQADPLKLEAAEFLIANMDGHGYIVHGFFDEEGNEVEFDALDHANFKEALAAFDALEAEHGTIDYERKRFEPDLETITAGFLIENIDLAFQAWREKPWASQITFEAFCEYILPYRGSNEPIESWRPVCVKRLAHLTGELEDPEDLAAAGRAVRAEAGRWVGFNEIYYLHPTDQGFTEMLEARLGRCEDISNMLSYAFRASAVMSATDYTPYWADRDNNHAWEVLLDSAGRGRAGLSHRAAKIYRKTFSIQRDSLGAVKTEDEKVPRWLAGRNYRDVTPDYMQTTDVPVRLIVDRPEGARFAYLCVFNGGEWKAIHWSPIEGEHATFTDMGRRIAYLPAYYVDEEPVPAAEPFILTADGEVLILDGTPGGTIDIEIAEDGEPTIRVKPGIAYELFVWQGDWDSVGRRTADAGQAATFEPVSAARLYWLVADGSRRLERIFTVEDGKVVYW
ncbi:MAG: hypothetical protein ACYSWT_04185 [Planctomycetota bacterium]